jgi:hypothetical protein
MVHLEGPVGLLFNKGKPSIEYEYQHTSNKAVLGYNLILIWKQKSMSYTSSFSWIKFNKEV